MFCCVFFSLYLFVRFCFVYIVYFHFVHIQFSLSVIIHVLKIHSLHDVVIPPLVRYVPPSVPWNDCVLFVHVCMEMNGEWGQKWGPARRCKQEGWVKGLVFVLFSLLPLVLCSLALCLLSPLLLLLYFFWYHCSWFFYIMMIWLLRWLTCASSLVCPFISYHSVSQYFAVKRLKPRF